MDINDESQYSSRIWKAIQELKDVNIVAREKIGTLGTDISRQADFLHDASVEWKVIHDRIGGHDLRLQNIEVMLKHITEKIDDFRMLPLKVLIFIGALGAALGFVWNWSKSLFGFRPHE